MRQSFLRVLGVSLALALLVGTPATAEAGPLGWALSYAKTFFHWPSPQAKARAQRERNRLNGSRREAWAMIPTRLRYFASKVQTQKYLLTANGEWARDRRTGEARRMDLVALSPRIGIGPFSFRYVVAALEVKPYRGRQTDPRRLTADEQAQKEKTDRILRPDGRHYQKLFIQDDNGELVPIKPPSWPIFGTKFGYLHYR